MSTTVSVKMPRLGESVTEGTVVRWHVTAGRQVKAFETIVEVDTDKVSTDVPSPVSGVVRTLLVKEGDSVLVGAEIVLIDVEQTSDSSTTAAAPAPIATAPASQGSGSESPSPAEPADSRASGNTDPAYSPAVRELARTSAIDLAQVAGSGTGGRVTRKDVLAAIEQQRNTPTDPPTSRPNTMPGAKLDGDERVPLTRMRRLIAESMTLSKTSIPHAWQSQEVDMSGVVANRVANKAYFEEREGFSLTYLPYVVAATVAALKQHPSVNATFAQDHVVRHRAINVGIAIGLEEGVLVPVIRNADDLSIAGVARAINDLATRAREARLKADDLRDGTFTINNTGTFGTIVSYSVINPGQAGIVTMGAIKERVVAIDGRIAIRPMMFLSFSLDHRILDGLEGARFLSACRHGLLAIDARTSIY